MSLRAGAAALAVLLTGCHQPTTAENHSAGKRAALGLLTGLPLAFGDSFSLEAEPHPAMTRLQKTFDVQLVDGPDQLGGTRLLLAAQPRALTATRLEQLDAWVRGGGHLLLLADPWLTWESEAPLGDKGRPPVEFSDTGLLTHWGLSLEGDRMPAMDRVERQLGGRSVAISAPGRLSRGRGSCVVAPDGFVARCSLGRGQVVVVADADFLNGPAAVTGQEALVAELEALNR